MSQAYRIRRFEPSDLDALYEICLLTADAGKDATGMFSNPRLPGYLWAAAYGTFEPNFAFLLVDGDRALGYVLAAPDTAAFEARLAWEWWPKVRSELSRFKPATALDRMALGRINAPEGHDAALLGDYPAHLHINLLPEAQSSGWGRRMIDTELEALRSAGVKGVHLGLHPDNTRAGGFYQHLGFSDISEPGHVTYGMKLQ